MTIMFRKILLLGTSKENLRRIKLLHLRLSLYYPSKTTHLRKLVGNHMCMIWSQFLGYLLGNNVEVQFNWMFCGFENFNNFESPFDVAVVERFERSSKRTRKKIKENLRTNFFFLIFNLFIFIMEKEYDAVHDNTYSSYIKLDCLWLLIF